ncbi:MAG: ABC transporter substrate-binding protein [Nitriliruptoraceae bacterium]
MTATQRRASRRHVLVGALLSIVLAAGACTTSPERAAPDADAADPAAEPGKSADDVPAEGDYPVTVGSLEIDRRPERIVSLSPSATEMLFAIGAGDAVVAADEYSDYPAEAPTTDLSGFQPNVEAIAAWEPDLVVASDDLGDLAVSLEAVGIPLLLQPAPADVEGVYAHLADLGLATGEIDGAADVISKMQAEIASIVNAAPETDEPRTYYHELAPDHYSITSSTFIGEVYRLANLISIADAAGETGNPYPQLSPEFILDADPDLILLADVACCDVTAESIRQRPGWDTLTAVVRGSIIELDEDVASRWGPRIVELLRDVVDALDTLDAAV